MAEKVKITFESSQDTNTVECDGIAGVAFNRKEGGYENQLILVGSMSVKDMVALHETIEEELLSLIKREIVKDSKQKKQVHGVSLQELLDALLS